MRSQLTSVVGTDILQHRAPNLGLHLGVRLVELHLVNETALEGRIEVTRQVRGGNENTVEVLHFLQNNVLHSIVHFLHLRTVTPYFAALAEDGVGLVEEQDRHNLTPLTEIAVAVEHLFDILLALAHELVAQTRNIHLHKVATGLTCYLQNGLGLACTRCAIEQTGKALAHTLLLKSLLDGRQVIGAEQTAQSLYLLLLRLVEEQRFLLDILMVYKVAVAGLTHSHRCDGRKARKKSVLGLLRKNILFMINDSVFALELNETPFHEFVLLVGKKDSGTVSVFRFVNLLNGMQLKTFLFTARPFGIVGHR